MSRRNPLAKGFFFESNREKWCAIGCGLGLLVMVASGYQIVKDPAPYLSYFMMIISILIAGASASDLAKTWKISSTTEARMLTEDKTYTEEVNHTYTTINITEFVVDQDHGGPALKPFGAQADEEGTGEDKEDE